MLSLSDDKSAYGQFVGLVEALKKDAADQQHAMSRNAERTHAHQYHKGMFHALNQTIAMIYSTDVWRTEAPRHWHTVDEVTGDKHTHATKADLDAYMAGVSYVMMQVSQCSKLDCDVDE